MDKTHKVIVFILLLIIGASAVIAYRGASDNGFMILWDTGCYVVHNANIQRLHWENIRWMFTALHCANWHPLTWLSHAVDYNLYGLNPQGHHISSVLIHAGNAVLLFFLACLIFLLHAKSRVSYPAQLPYQRIIFAAGISALLFAIHPHHVESVAWVAERKNVLCQFFSLLTLLGYFLYAGATPGWRRITLYLATLLCFIAALLSKAMAVTLPALLLLLDVYPLRRTTLTAVNESKTVPYLLLGWEKLPFFMLSGLVIVITLQGQQSADLLQSTSQFGLSARVLNAFNSILGYIAKFLLPLNLSPFYPHTPDIRANYLSLIPVFSFVLITLVCAYFWYKKQYYWLAAWLFYLIALSPVVGIIQVGNQASADRYAYFTTLPFYLLTGAGVVRLWYWGDAGRGLFRRGAVVIVGLFIIPGLVYLTGQQVLVWRNDKTLWTYLSIQEPQNPGIQLNLMKLTLYEGQDEIAAQHAARAAAGNYHTYPEIAATYFRFNRLLQALAVYQKMLTENIDSGQSKDRTYYQMAVIHLRQGEKPKARELLQKALEVNPQSQESLDLLDKTD